MRAKSEEMVLLGKKYGGGTDQSLIATRGRGRGRREEDERRRDESEREGKEKGVGGG